MKRQTDPYSKAMKNYVNKRVKQKYIYLNKLPNISVCKPSSAPEEGLFSNRNIGQFV